jgi:hypothetical protein
MMVSGKWLTECYLNSGTPAAAMPINGWFMRELRWWFKCRANNRKQLDTTKLVRMSTMQC